MRRLLALVTLIYMGCAGFALAQEAAAPVDNQGWSNVYDFQERNAFLVYGPPLQEDAAHFRDETQLYLDMLNNFYTIDSDEDDFAFVVEAFSVPVAEFRPASFRPDATDTGDLFEDDPLPESVKSSSAYVHNIRSSVMPGMAFRPRSVNDVKLSDADVPKSLFFEKPVEALADPKDKEKEDADKAKKDAEAKEKADEKDAKAGHINAPQKPGIIPGSDQETLQMLQQAVKELGLEKQLNFEPNKGAQTLAQMMTEKDKAAADAAAAAAKQKEEDQLGPLLGNSGRAKAKADAATAAAAAAKPADAAAATDTAPADGTTPPVATPAATPAPSPATPPTPAKPPAKTEAAPASAPAPAPKAAPKAAPVETARKPAPTKPVSRLIANKPVKKKPAPVKKKKTQEAPAPVAPAAPPVYEAPSPAPPPAAPPTSDFSLKKSL